MVFIEINTIYNEDCLVGMDKIPNKSVDMILCDLPYGTTQCKWDVVIPFDNLWKQYERIIKDNGAIVLFGSQPFTSLLIASNLKLYRYNWVWDKVSGSNPLLAKKQPLKNHEDICVFYKKHPIYNPQMTEGKKWSRGGKNIHQTDTKGNTKLVKGDDSSTTRYPKTIITFSNADKTKNIHPTQKPIDLFEYLIKTYTSEGEVILDNCIGSGTTAIACMKTNRKYIGFELDNTYYNLALSRIDKHIKN